MKKHHNGGIMPLFIIMLCFVFAVSASALILLGMNIYRDISHQGMSGHAQRTSMAYIATKLRHMDAKGQVEVGDYNGVSALYLYEDYEGIAYVTVIYQWDGALRETFCRRGLEIAPENGTRIADADFLEFSMISQNVISVHCDTAEGSSSMLLNLRSSKEGPL